MFLKRESELESKKRLSESMLWTLQEDFYDKSGVNAWVGKVPYFITSNAFIADSYARTTLRYLQDCLRSGALNTRDPCYILELAAGSGKFSFLTLKRLLDLQPGYGLEELSLCYIMSDFTDNNLTFWESQPQLQPYIESGQLDFALFNMESDTAIQLRHQQQQAHNDNPLIVYGNYIFDTVRHDAFYIENHYLHQSVITTSTPKDNLKGGSPKNLDLLETQFTHQPIADDFYEIPAFNRLLSFYKEHILTPSTVLLPVTGLRCLNNLQQNFKKMLLLSTDKGHAHLEELEGCKEPHIAFHGSFSLMVNFHAIGRFFTDQEGHYFSQTLRNGIKTVACVLGHTTDDLRETTLSASQAFDGFSTANFFGLHTHIKKGLNDHSIDVLTHYLELAHWDPYVFNLVCKRIQALIKQADFNTQRYILERLPDVAAQFYFMPDDQNPLFEIGLIFHAMEDYETALDYYKQSSRYFGDPYWTIYNIALCQQKLGLKKEALLSFKLALPKMPDPKECQQFIFDLERELGM